MFDSLLTTLLPTLAAVAIGILTPKAMGLLKNYVTFIDRRAPWIQQMLVPVIAWGLAEAGALLNVVLPTDITLLTSGDVSGAIAAAVALAVHAASKNK